MPKEGRGEGDDEKEEAREAKSTLRPRGYAIRYEQSSSSVCVHVCTFGLDRHRLVNGTGR